MRSLLRPLVQKRRVPSTQPHLLKDKLQLIDYAFGRLGARSFADLGGTWRVMGGYTFYALDHHPVTRAFLVDTFRLEQINRTHPALTKVVGNFGDRAVVAKLGHLDAIFLFDVLLHQVAPNWDQILEKYAPVTNLFVIYNQQFIATSHTVRLLELGEEAYFKNVPPHTRADPQYANLFCRLDEIVPRHGRPVRDIHSIWQWGITDQDLTGVMTRLGFRLEYYMNCGRFEELENFENHAFVFRRAQDHISPRQS